MTTSAFVLVLSILVLGGAIATAGDRIGTKVGKARLSLFNLRPRSTAVVVTMLTGVMVSASTLAVLFATSEQLRIGVFRLETIQKRLRAARRDLDAAVEQKKQIESELTKARADQVDAQKRLDTTNEFLKTAIAKQAETATQLNRTQTQLSSVSSQAELLRSDIQKTRAEREQLIQQRDLVKAELAQLKAENTQALAENTQLKAENTSIKSENNSLKGQNQQLKAQNEQVSAQNNQLDARNAQLSAQNNQLGAQNTQLSAQNNQLKTQNNQLGAQNNQLKTQNQQLNAEVRERDQEIANKARTITERENKIAGQDRVIVQRETRLKQLEENLSQKDRQISQKNRELQERSQQLQEREKQLAFLQQEVAALEQYYQSYQVLRQGNVALLRGEVLASGVVRIVDPSAARKAVDQLLTEANRTAIEQTKLGTTDVDQRVVQITQAEVDRLLSEIKDGRDYVVRILSGGNYVKGEKQVQVLANAVVNQVVFKAGDVIATTSADSATMSEEQMRQRLEQLVVASQFRARRGGILGDKVQIGDGRIITLINFIEQLKEYGQPVDLAAVIAEDTYTAGPLKMKLVALKKGQVIFST
jgi:uncharacterized protein (DUF3084 family)